MKHSTLIPFWFFLSWMMLQACQQHCVKPDFGSKLLEVEALNGFSQSSGNLIFVDCREKQQYEDGHISGALHIWRSELMDERQMMLSRQEIEQVLGKKGISARDTLLIYDDHGCAEAARLWWVLHVHGFEQTYLINGGLSHMKRKGLLVTTEIVHRQGLMFAFEDTATMQTYIDMPTLKSELAGNKILLIDTRTKAEHDGQELKKGASVAGHIEGSQWLDYSSAVDQNPEADKRILPREQLKALFASHQIPPESNIVTYCHSGTRSAQMTFILTQVLDYRRVRNYDGSWIEWSADLVDK